MCEFGALRLGYHAIARPVFEIALSVRMGYREGRTRARRMRFARVTSGVLACDVAV